MELICRVTGFPKPEIKWERVDGVMPKNAVTTQEGNLVLAKVTKNDEGTYRCVGENTAGKSEGLAEIRVQSKENIDSFNIIVRLKGKAKGKSENKAKFPL